MSEKKITKWTGWNKLSSTKPNKRKNLKNEIISDTKPVEQFKTKTITPFQKTINTQSKKEPTKFNFNKLKKIEKEEINDKTQILYSQKISKINQTEIPSLCQICGSSIKQEFFQIYTPSLTKICRRCKQSLPKCANCGTPVKDEIKGLEKHYCPSCKNTSRCTSCQKKVNAKDLTRIEGEKGIYCQTCLNNNNDICVFCQLPTKNKSSEDDYPICQFCQQTAITSTNKADTIHEKILNFFYELEPDFLTDPLELELTPYKYHKEFKTQNNRYYYISKEKAFIAKGIPEPLLQEIFLNYYSQNLIKTWSKVPQKSTLWQALYKFLKLLYFEKENFYLEFNKLKKTSLKEYKEFQPLYQTLDKLGNKKSFQYLRKKLSDTCLKSN